MQWLAEICVKRPVFATMLILSLVVVGMFSFLSLGVDLFPKIDFPTITVTVINPGASRRFEVSAGCWDVDAGAFGVGEARQRMTVAAGGITTYTVN